MPGSRPGIKASTASASASPQPGATSFPVASVQVEVPRQLIRRGNMQETIRQVRSDGMDVSNDDIAHLSPLIACHCILARRPYGN